MLERLRQHRWLIVMVLIIVASSSSLIWYLRQRAIQKAAPSATFSNSELTALQQLQEENNALAVELQQLKAGGTVKGAETEVSMVSDKVNVNTATEAELDTLPGIGPSKAAAIIEYRTEHGPFKAPYDITNVKGIGESTYQELQDLIVVD